MNRAQRRDRPVRRLPSAAELLRAAAARRAARRQAVRWTLSAVACTAIGAVTASWLPPHVALAALAVVAGWGAWVAWRVARSDLAAAHPDAGIRLRVRGLRLPLSPYDLDRR